MTRHTISLPDQMSEYVTRQVDSGKFGGLSDYVRNLIRNDQQEKENVLEELKLLIEEGEASGYQEFSMDDIVKSARKKLGV